MIIVLNSWLPIRQRHNLCALTTLFSLLNSTSAPSYLALYLKYWCTNDDKQIRSSIFYVLMCVRIIYQLSKKNNIDSHRSSDRNDYWDRKRVNENVGMAIYVWHDLITSWWPTEMLQSVVDPDVASKLATRRCIWLRLIYKFV